MGEKIFSVNFENLVQKNNPEKVHPTKIQGPNHYSNEHFQSPLQYNT